MSESNSHRETYVEYVRADVASLNDELLDMLETIENDNGAIPSWLWKRIQVTISKAGGNAKPVNAKKDGAYE